MRPSSTHIYTYKPGRVTETTRGTGEHKTLSPAAAFVFLSVSYEASAISRAGQHIFKLSTRILFSELHSDTTSANKKLDCESEKTNISQIS